MTSLINPGGSNALAILVTPPAHGCKDLSACTVDWNPEAPDMNAGLWGTTMLDTTGPVALADPYVKTVLPLPATNSADLTVYVDAVNATNAPVTTTVNATITKAGHPTHHGHPDRHAERRTSVARSSSTRPPIRSFMSSSPALWWPYQFGTP